MTATTQRTVLPGGLKPLRDHLFWHVTTPEILGMSFHLMS